ncbi:glycoside hydrolase family 2 TIM barrel-domain containing protein [Paenibacillus oryzisoli]|uniref:glycoside hydrolase family 2 TIM barrel-domain containing protein n=1 Tax=Paenibacillus oryzisoli TaxID=1850517 RepID=UPI003D273634
MNTKVRWMDGWTFAKSGLELTDWSRLPFEPVDLPHDWLIYDTSNLYENSIGWYRKTLVWAAADLGRRVLLSFDGVYMDSSVYVNGRFVGEWKYGYSAFEHDITDALVEGDNEVIVKVVHQSPNSRWYSGAGIYRDVWLITRGQEYIPTHGIYAAAVRKGERWELSVETELSLRQDGWVTQTLLYGGEPVAAVTEQAAATMASGAELVVAAKARGGDEAGCAKLSQMLEVEGARVWSPDEPNLYRLVTELRVAGADGEQVLVECIEQNVGFREVVLDPQTGFYLNGTRMKLNGVCEHHDLGALGAAFNLAALRRRFQILKEMGVNAIRTAHNMHAKAFMELADEMGFLIVSEAFDMWERAKTTYDYARFFKAWAQRDVASWIRRDRNHPSLILWSIGNEIYDTHADGRGQEITRMLAAEVMKHDPKGNGRVTIGSNYMPWENAQLCADIVKIAGYNYAEKYYHKHHEEHPDWVIYGSETASLVQSRGIYRFPFERSILADDDEQCSALGNSTTSWGAKSVEACIIAEREAPFSLGQFIWTGFDYIGEPTPYHTKNAYLGQIDTATFQKDSYYIYQSAWTDYRAKPMVHIFPYWDWNPGEVIDVRVCSNAPKIELQLNGVTVGTFDIDHRHGSQLVGWWKLPYEPGELKALAYDEAGRVIATAVQHSFGDAHEIRLTPDKAGLVADGEDLMFVEIAMADRDGNPVENATNRVQVEVTGAGRLLGLDNGDSTDYDAYKGVSRRLFSGKLMALIGARLEPGTVRVEVTSEGLAPQVLTFEVRAAEPGKAATGGPALRGIAEEVLWRDAVQGVSAATSNQAQPVVTGALREIPVRKIEIVSPMGQQFDAERRGMTVQARLYPANTSYTDVEWSVVNDAGIASNLARVEASGGEAKLIALGDGEFRLRCTSRNGTAKTKLISQLEFTATGLGTAYKDPYGFISAGLYDYSKGDVGNGNERGVATSRDGETQVGFRGIDFGAYGSDRITLPIFALTGEPYALQIWEGMPDEAGSELLADVIYQKPSRWNVYQEETYRLSRRLTGITSLCFVLQKKVHIKGFSFEKVSRAYEVNHAAVCDQLYGDTFTRSGTCVEGIGNNVSLVFGGMDFGSEGATKLVVCGGSPIAQNTIHLRFSGSAGDSNQVIEFTGSDGYEERVFEIERVTGEQSVIFVFLPGSQFDFGWFRFER